MKKLRYNLFYLLLCVGITGCEVVHEFPDDNSVNPYLVDVSIAIDLNMSFESDTIFQTYAQMLSGDYDVRYIVDVYKKDESRSDQVTDRVARIVKTGTNIISKGIYHIRDTLTLPVDKYEIIAWIDFVDKGKTTDKYYQTTNLQKISIIPQNGKYNGYNTTKDAFTGKCDMDLTPYRHQRFIHYSALIESKRPFAVYQIITTDINEYMTYHQTLSYSSVRPSTTRLWYNLFFPMGYNSYLFAPDNFKTGVDYVHDIIEIAPEKEAIIASDFVFLEDDSFYFVDFEIISADGKHINTVSGLKINLKRNRLTIIRSEFLTKDLNPDSKIGVDDQFIDEIIIHI